MDNLNALALRFAAMGNADSLKLVTFLADRGPSPIACLAAEVGLTEPAAYKRLNELRLVGLVMRRHTGPGVRIWSAEAAALAECSEFLFDRVNAANGVTPATSHEHEIPVA